MKYYTGVHELKEELGAHTEEELRGLLMECYNVELEDVEDTGFYVIGNEIHIRE